jgi:hypothetical protein
MRSADERAADSPEHAPERKAPECGDRAHQCDAGAHHADSDDHGQPAATHIGEQAGRNLAEKDAKLQQRAGERQLERPKAGGLHGVERGDRPDHAVQHPDGGDGPDVEQVWPHAGGPRAVLSTARGRK